MKSKRVLAATDFSRHAESALRRAALLAKATGADLELVHAVYMPPLAGAWTKLIEGEGITEESLREKAAVRLGELATSLAQRLEVPPPATRVLSGKPAQALAAWAQESATELIVVGAHGEHLLLDLFVGSTALKLLRLADRPVLLVKQTPPFDYERILVATDFSPAARAAADLAAQMFPVADLYLFNAYEAPFERQMYYAGSDDEAVDHYRRLGEAEARQQMEEFAATLAAPERFVRKLRHGYAPALINQYAAEMGADLLVVGSNRQSEIAATLLGSVAAPLVNETRGALLLVPLIG
jgi:nucleotide-binding universal stress UspA family protein